MIPKNKLELYNWLDRCFIFSSEPGTDASAIHSSRASNLADFYVTRDFFLWDVSNESEREAILEEFYKKHIRTGITPDKNPISNTEEVRELLEKTYRSWEYGTLKTVYNRKHRETSLELEKLKKNERDLHDYQTEPIERIDGQKFLQIDMCPF